MMNTTINETTTSLRSWRTIVSITLVLITTRAKLVSGFKPSQYGSGASTPPTSSATGGRGAAFDGNNGGDDNMGYPPSQENQQYYDDGEYYPPETGGSPTLDDFDNESVEERLANWRAEQQRKFENQTPIDAANPRDEEGRMKLLASVSRGSISLFFFILMWRSVHHFELADQSFQKAPTTRLLLVVPTILLFIGNMAGCVAAITSSQTKAAKKRMKAVLNLNKLVELLILIYNVMRMTLFPSKLILREIYVGRTLSNFLFMVQCQLFTKVTWGATQVNPSIASDMDAGEYDQSYSSNDQSSYSPYGQDQGGYEYNDGTRNDDGYGQRY